MTGTVPLCGRRFSPEGGKLLPHFCIVRLSVPARLVVARAALHLPFVQGVNIYTGKSLLLQAGEFLLQGFIPLRKRLASLSITLLLRRRLIPLAGDVGDPLLQGTDLLPPDSQVGFRREDVLLLQMEPHRL